MDIDLDKLRYDLIEYLGAAAYYNQMAMYELVRAENAQYGELVQIAIRNGINLENYRVEQKLGR